MIDFIWLFFLLVFGHFLADYPLQGEFLANAKNKNTAIGKVFWKHALPAHSFIHAGFVGVILGIYCILKTGATPPYFIVLFAFAEGIIHGITDFMKCENKLTMLEDQACHIWCKLGWATFTVLLLNPQYNQL